MPRKRGWLVGIFGSKKPGKMVKFKWPQSRFANAGYLSASPSDISWLAGAEISFRPPKFPPVGSMYIYFAIHRPAQNPQ